jgi:hypothetical protein
MLITYRGITCIIFVFFSHLFAYHLPWEVGTFISVFKHKKLLCYEVTKLNFLLANGRIRIRTNNYGSMFMRPKNLPRTLAHLILKKEEVNCSLPSPGPRQGNPAWRGTGGCRSRTGTSPHTSSTGTTPCWDRKTKCFKNLG